MALIGKTFKQQLYLNSSTESFAKAKELRQNQTSAEKILWLELKNSKCNGLKFRRQHPILSFVADFYCYSKKLVIEVDGSVHENEVSIERDKARTQELENFGIKVLRFTNEQVFFDIDNVLKKIAEVSSKLK